MNRKHSPENVCIFFCCLCGPLAICVCVCINFCALASDRKTVAVVVGFVFIPFGWSA